MEMSDRNDGDDIPEIRNVDPITSYVYIFKFIVFAQKDIHTVSSYNATTFFQIIKGSLQVN